MKVKPKIISIILILAMFMSTATSAFAYSGAWAKPGGGGSSGTAIAGSNWSQNSQFLRVSLYFASGGGNEEGPVNTNWNLMRQYGHSVDLAINDGNNPYAYPVQHSDFKSAIDYVENYNSNKMGRSDYGDVKDYFSTGQAWGVDRYSFVDNNGSTMEFPWKLGRNKKGTDIKYFFEQDDTLNAVLWYTGLGCEQGYRPTQGLSRSVYPDAIDYVKAGVYVNKDGTVDYGTYILVVEPGVYSPINGVYSAYTARDAVNWNNGSNDALSASPFTIGQAAQGLVLEAGEEYEGLGLSYVPPLASLDSKNIDSHYDDIRSSWGVGVFMWWSKQQNLPVIKYYYNLTQSDLDRAARAGTSSGTSGQIAGTVPQFSYTEENGVPMLVESEYGYDENHRYGLRPKQGGAKYTLAEAIKKYPQLVNDKADNAEAIPNTAENYTAEAKETFKEQDYFLAGHYFNQRFPLVSNYGSGLTSVALRIFKVCPCKYQGQAYGAKAPLIFT